MYALSFVSLSSRHEIQRADQSVQVDPMPVVKQDIRASKTDSVRIERYQPGAEIVFPDGECLATGGEVAAVVCASVCWRAS